MRFASAFIACAGSAAAVLAASFCFAPSQSASAANAPVEPVTAPVPADGFGTIKGRLVYGGSEAPKMPPLDVKGKPFCETKTVLDRAVMVDPKNLGIANAIVWLPKPIGKNLEAEKVLLKQTPAVEIDNKDCEFLPRSTAMHKSQKLVFTSSDDVGHNSHVMGFSYGCNLALAPKGKADAPKLQTETRPMALVCDIHSWMKGNVLVCDHPFFAVTSADGSFEIKGVPAGTQNIIIWQEKVGYVSTGGSKGQAVTVKADTTTDIGDIKLDPAKIKK